MDLIKFAADHIVIDVANHTWTELSADWEIAQDAPSLLELGNSGPAVTKTNLFSLMGEDAKSEGLITADQLKQLEAAAPLAKQVGEGVKNAVVELATDFDKKVS